MNDDERIVLHKTPFLFNHKLIPRPFRKTYLKLLDEVVKYFTEQYSSKGKFPKSETKFEYLDKIFTTNMQTDFT